MYCAAAATPLASTPSAAAEAVASLSDEVRQLLQLPGNERIAEQVQQTLAQLQDNASKEQSLRSPGGKGSRHSSPLSSGRREGGAGGDLFEKGRS